VTTTPLRELPVRRELDVAPGAVLAAAWLAAIIATSLTLWILVAVVGSGGG
jgi:hypothetical protein